LGIDSGKEERKSVLAQAMGAFHSRTIEKRMAAAKRTKIKLLWRIIY
jgi:hypothetical protein